MQEQLPRNEVQHSEHTLPPLLDFVPHSNLQETFTTPSSTLCFISVTSAAKLIFFDLAPRVPHGEFLVLILLPWLTVLKHANVTL